jgi:hypothetical protein
MSVGTILEFQVSLLEAIEIRISGVMAEQAIRS